MNCVGSRLLLWILSKVGNFKGLVVNSHLITILMAEKDLQGKIAIIWRRI